MKRKNEILEKIAELEKEYAIIDSSCRTGSHNIILSVKLFYATHQKEVITAKLEMLYWMLKK